MFTLINQFSVESADYRIALCRTESSHIEHGTHTGAASLILGVRVKTQSIGSESLNYHRPFGQFDREKDAGSRNILTI